jgi:ribonuclease HII
MKKRPEFTLDAHYQSQGYRLLAGTDEAGRGPIAGPVVAAAVLIHSRSDAPYIYDSKKMTEKERDLAYAWICKHALSYAIEVIDADTIDRINILEASRLGMMRSLDRLTPHPDFIVTDAMKLSEKYVPYEAVIRGDQKVFAVACASILAKVTRDRIMVELDHQYPGYGFAAHKGYPTPMHLNALNRLGILPHVHRTSFGPVKTLHSISLWDK